MKAPLNWRNLPRNVWAATLTSFFTDVASEMLAYLLPLFLANVLGASTVVIGLIEGIAETTASLLKAGSGWLSDKLGNRKWLAVAGYGVSAVARPFLLVVTAWPGVLAVRFSDRVGKGIRTAPRDALIADSIALDQRGVAFGLHRAGDTFGAMVGQGLALTIVLLAQAQALTLQRETFQWVVVAAVIPGVLGVLVLAFGVREAAVAKADRAVGIPKVALPRQFWWFLGVVALFTLGNSSDAFLVLRAQERGLNVVQVLGMLMVFNLLYAVLAGPLGALSDRVGRRRVLIGGWLVYALVYAGFALAGAGWQIAGLFVVYGVYYAAAEGVAKALVADLTTSEQRGMAYGLFNATVGLMALPASVLAGVVWQGVGAWGGFGASAPFWLGAGLALAAGVLLWGVLGQPVAAD